MIHDQTMAPVMRITNTELIPTERSAPNHGSVCFIMRRVNAENPCFPTIQPACSPMGTASELVLIRVQPRIHPTRKSVVNPPRMIHGSPNWEKASGINLKPENQPMVRISGGLLPGFKK